MNPMLSQLLMGFLFVTIGFITGAAVSYWLIERDKSNVAVNAAPQSKEETIPVDQAFVEVFRIYREKVSEKILIKINDKMAPTRVDLNKPELIMVEKVVKEAMDWIGIQLPKVSVMPVAPLEKPLMRLETAENDLDFERQVPQIKLPVLLPKKTAPVEKQETRSFVEQIDDILQEMLELTPLKDRNIKLAEDPRDGVIAWIGNKRYVGIDAIDDPDVQKLIKIAVAKWEKLMERAARSA